MHKSYFKEPVLRDRPYLDTVKKLICCNCGGKPYDGLNDPHHDRRGWFSQSTPPDDRVVPMCRDCHSDLHNTGEKRYWKDRKPENLAFKLRVSYTTGQGDGHMNRLVDMWRDGKIK